MDVEQIQKINKLALDLMRQGLAHDREDAVIQAEKVFHAKDGEYNSIRDRMQQEPQQGKNSSSPQEDLQPEKIKDILEQNTKFLVKKITQFQEQIAAMEKEIQNLRTSQTYNRIQSASEVLARDSSGQVKPQEIKSQEIKQVRGEEKKSESHPRLGNYTAGDVSVEKFFYMGSK